MFGKLKKIGLVIGEDLEDKSVFLKSSENISRNIDKNKYLAENFYISKKDIFDFNPIFLKENFSAVFLVSRGFYKKEGTLQRILEENKIPYVGSGPLSSSLAANKFLCLKLFKSAGLDIPPTFLFDRLKWISDKERILKEILLYLKTPLVLKPNMSDSGIWVKLANNYEELEEGLNFLFTIFSDVLVQEFIDGVEVSCGAVSFDNPRKSFALVPAEIVKRGKMVLDYNAKYLNENSYLEIVPARLPFSFLERVRKIAALTHNLIGAKYFSKTDMIIGKNGKIYVLEVNTTPPLFKNSTIEKGAEAYGLPFAKLLDMALQSI